MSRSADAATVSRLALRVTMAAFDGPQAPPWLLERLGQGLGSVCLFGSNVTSGSVGDDAGLRALTDELHAAAGQAGGAGCLVAVDEEGGDVTRLDVHTGSAFPAASALGVVDDVAATRELAGLLGRRLRAAGIDLDLAPVADVNCEPDNPVIGTRSFGADPALVARHVVAAVGGLQGAGVAACVKHFPGHGATREDSHLSLPRLDVSPEQLRSRELVPFAAAVAAGAAAMMTSHILVAALDPLHPATTSPAAVSLLREELGFDGVLVSDALDMAGVAGPSGGMPAAAVAALAAGCDLLCLGRSGDEAGLSEVVAEIARATLGGRLDLSRLREAAARVDRLARRPLPEAASGPATGLPACLATWALRLDGTPARLDGALVVEFDVEAGIAAGPEVPSELAGPLAAVLPGIEQWLLRPGEPVAPVLAAAAGRALIAVVRDAHRHPGVLAAVRALAGARADLVVVETGWPHPDLPLPGAVQVRTHGTARVSLDAAAAVLARPAGTVGPAQAPGPA